MNSLTSYPFLKRMSCFLITGIFLFTLSGLAQENPPRPILVSVSNAQHLNFGTIIPISDSGGSVYIDHNGTPTPNGDILLLHTYQCSASLFIVDAEPGVLINIIYTDPNPKLSKSGNNLQMHLGTPNIDSQDGFAVSIKMRLLSRFAIILYSITPAIHGF